MPKQKKQVTRKRATIYDIAREAKVSTGTVSRALNNSDQVNAETRERVLGISRRLGMRPRATVKRTHFAIVVPSQEQVAGGFVEAFVYELIRELSLQGCALSAFTDSQLDNLRRWIFDGIFVATWSEAAQQTLGSLQNTPVIGFNRFHNRGPFHIVGWDHVAEGRLVAEYLLAKGHRRLAFVAAPPINAEGTLMRLKGFREACADGGYPLGDERVELIEDSGQFYAALQRVVQQQADGIFIPGHGKYAVEAISILQSLMHLRVPNDISVIGGESPGWSGTTTPPLTTVHVPFSELASRAVTHMYSLIAKRPLKPLDSFLDPTIIERKSVANRSDAAAKTAAR